MNIDGFGIETIERLIKINELKNFSDIYALSKQKLISIDRMAEKSAQNLLTAIKNSISQPFHKVLFSLGIRHVGETVALNLVNHFKTIENLMNADLDQIISVNEIGDKIAESLIEFFDDFENKMPQTKNDQLIGVRETFDGYNLISALHSFHSIKDENYKNILPPLTLLSEEKQKELIEKLNKLKFISEKILAA